MGMIADNLSTFVDVVRLRTQESSYRTAYTFLKNGEIEEKQLSYGELDYRARACGAVLQQMEAAGERALSYSPGRPPL